MNWFKHDTGATQDAKLKKLIIRHGAVGYAIYFHCLELIAGDVSETNITFELEHDSEIIAENLHIRGSAEKSGIAIVEEIMRTIIGLGLFQENGGRVFCFKLLKRLDLSMTSNPDFRKLIASAKMENHDIIMTNHDTIMRASKQDKQDKQDKREDALPAEDAPASSKRFTKPSLQEVQEYCHERGGKVDAQKWLDYYESNGWKVGRNSMKDWKAAVRTWERNEYGRSNGKRNGAPTPSEIIIPDFGHRRNA